MSIFEMHRLIIDEYRKYVQSFLSVADERVRSFIETPVRGSPNCHQDYEKMKAGIPCGSGSPDRYFFPPGEPADSNDWVLVLEISPV